MNNQLNLQDIKTVLVLGCGTLGLRIAIQCAVSGYQVHLYDISSKALEKSENVELKLLHWLSKQAELGLAPKESIDTIQARISRFTDAEKASESVDLMIESVPEVPQIKTEVFQLFNKHLPAHCILTTNTSFLLPSQFAEATGRAERFCALHFHDVFYANVVDVMPHPNTDSWIIPVLKEFGQSIRQTPVVIKKETPGYLYNSMLVSYLQAAVLLFANDAASIEDIDKSWMGNTKMPMGPFGILDHIGLETVIHVLDAQDPPSKENKAFKNLIQSYISEGKLGIKTGEGFYKYPNPAYKAKDFLTA